MLDGIVLLCAAGILLSVFLMVYDAKRKSHELLQMEKMRRGKMYACLYHMVRQARMHDLDQVRIERDRVLFTTVCPPGKLCEFAFSQQHHRFLRNDATRTLMYLLAQDIPSLQNNRVYKLRKYKVQRPNGARDVAYVFTMRSRPKTKLMQARRRLTLD